MSFDVSSLFSTRPVGNFSLQRADPLFANSKRYQGGLQSSNLLSKAAQLVGDLEAARDTQTKITTFLAEIEAEGDANAAKLNEALRGSIIDQET